MSGLSLNMQDILDQVLSAGKELTIKGRESTAGVAEKGKEIGQKGEDLLIEKLGLEDTPAIRAALRKGLGTGAAAGGLLLLLSSKSGRKLATLGGLAGLGTIAYKAYKKGNLSAAGMKDEVAGLLSGSKADARSETLLRAMVSAAKADGNITEEEIAYLSANDDESVSIIMNQPCDPDIIASLADSEQAEREIYAASCRIADGLNEKERDYLDSLAMALRLDPDLAARIETDVRTG